MRRMDSSERKLTFLLLLLIIGWALPSAAASESPGELYARARRELGAALAVHDRDAKIDRIRKCIDLLQQVVQRDDGRAVTDKALYSIAQCYHTIYDTNQSPGDFKSALNYYRMVIQNCPSSPLADDAQYLIGILFLPDDPSKASAEFSKVLILFPDGDMAPKARQKKAELSKKLNLQDKPRSNRQTSGMAPPFPGGTVQKEAPAPVVEASSLSPGASTVPNSSGPPGTSPDSRKSRRPKRLDKIQHWSGPDYTRVVLYTSAPVSFEEEAVHGDPKTRQTGKVYLDLRDCKVGRKVKGNIRVMDTFLQWIRVKRTASGGTRVILESGSIERYRAFSLEDPPRLIVDVKGENTPQPSSRKEAQVPAPRPGSAGAESLARQLGLGVRKIVLDPGHGGKDKGATGYNHIYEKDITLALAKELQKILQTEIGCEVVLTRTRDRYLSLEERTAIGNAQKADLFISIHTNAHEDESIRGIETYFLNFSNDKESARVAAMENATSTRKISDLETILRDLMLNTKIKESSRLAACVQSRVVSRLRTKYDGLRDLGTKQAPFYVLVGAEMPSILIETGFITNPKEEKLLRDKEYRVILSKAIAKGILSYIRQTKNLASAGDRP